MKYMCGSCCIPTKFRVGRWVGKLLNFIITFNKENRDKTEKVPILGIFSPKTILMFRVGLEKLG